MYKKFLFLTSFVLVLSLAHTSYGDAVAPRPNPARWMVVPATLSPNSITMTAVTALDAAPDYPVDYNFLCTNDNAKNSGWQSSPTYTPTILLSDTVYTFQAFARDSVNNITGGSACVLSAKTDADTTPPVLRLDFNDDVNNGQYNDDANTYPGFLKFLRTNTGSEVNGVVIDIEGDNVLAARRGDPCGAYNTYGGGVTPDPCYYSPRAGEKIYRDFIYGAQNSEITITLWDLGRGRECNIMMWAFDACSTGSSPRIADWSVNGTHIFDTNFNGGSANWPLYENQAVPLGAEDLYLHAFKGTAKADANLGRIILTCTRDPSGEEDEPFAFVNALKVEPSALEAYVPTPYARRPVPFDGTEDVPAKTVLKWRNGNGVDTHDLYLGTNEDAVADANRDNHPGVAIYEVNLPTNANSTGYDPYGAATYLVLDTTYYWKVDENSPPPGPNIWPSVEVWSFTTCVNSVVENFNSYVSSSSPPSPAIKDTWLDYWTNGTRAEVFTTSTEPNRSGPPYKSMNYLYTNDVFPHYAEAEATIGPGANQLNIDKNWRAMDAKSLTLWFYGTATNDANERMYVKLTDGAAAFNEVDYPPSEMTDIREASWHEWNIPLTEFTGVDMNNVAKIAIGFGDGSDPAPATGVGTVYFEDIQIYATRCALIERDPCFALVDYSPAAALAGDCVIDNLEIETMADAWLLRDAVIDTNRPGDSNLVIWYHMNENDGNKIFNHPDTNFPDVCEARLNGNGKWQGTFWNNGVTPPGVYGTTWATPDYNGLGSCVYLDGSQGSRIQCGDPCRFGQLGLGIGSREVYPTDVCAMTLSAWVRWLGPRTWDPYLLGKSQGVIGKRGGWSDARMVWMLEADTPGNAGSFAIRHYAVGDDATPDVYSGNNILTPYIGRWAHIACTFPHPSGAAGDANSHARLYFNGGQVRDLPWRFSRGDDPNIYLSVGETQDQNAWPSCPESFYGYIDEVRIYNRVLGPNEIAYLADTTPEDGQLWIPIPSTAEVYSEEPQNHKVVNFKDLALVAQRWLTEDMFPL